MNDVFGVPAHPLIVHAVVVLIPLATVGVLLSLLFRPIRRRYLGLSVLGLALGAGAAFFAEQAGESLAATVGVPEAHAAWGEWVTRAATAAAVLGVGWFLLQRGKDRQGLFGTIAGVLTTVAAVAATTVTVLAGHSGAEAVWGGRTSDDPPASATPSPSTDATASTSTRPSPSASAAANAPKTYTLAQVKQHSTAGDCWAAINGGVYNLTDWVSRHPGGAQRIIAICGTDASAAFNREHGGQSRPESALTQFYVGKLG